MSIEFWKQVNGLLLQTLDCPPEQREIFLDESCAGDATLRREVALLLACSAGTALPIDHPAFDLLGSTPSVLEAGERIGPYLIQQELGRGGTGAVYLAMEVDGEFQKKVAIKVLKRGMDTDEIVQRFQRERRILANLDHPNIARFFAGAATHDHRPYLVMEYVDGQPIDRFCHAHRLGLSDRIELFLKVCDAVQFAHQNLVIHRDLKPSNILVTADGEPKLLDFGIAKILDPANALTPTLTVSSHRLMTPDYASPEQVMAEPMTTASDVYSLGVVLYQLLTDRRPYHVTSPLETAVRDVVCHREPTRPSVMVTRPLVADDNESFEPGRDDSRRLRPANTRRRRRRLRGDLDNIVLTALAKEPRHRYATVKHLADDLRRHLRGLPVSARKATWFYRLGKFARRHAGAFAIGVIFVLLLGGFGADRVLQQWRLTEQRRQKEQVAEFVQKLFDISDTTKPKGSLSARDLLDHGVRRIHEEVLDQPELRADLLMWVCEGYEHLGFTKSSEPLLREALDLRRQVHGEIHPKVAESLDKLAGWEFGQGHYFEEERLIKKSLDIRRQLHGDDHLAVVKNRHDLGIALMDQGRYSNAELWLRQALEDMELLNGPKRLVANFSGNLAIILHHQGKFAEAERLFDKATRLSIIDLQDDEHGLVTANIQNLANCLRDQGKFAAADEKYRHLIEIHDRRYGNDHPAAANLMHNQGLLKLLQGDLAEARRLVQDALKLRARFVDPDHPQLTYFRLTEARIQLAEGDAAGAEAGARSAHGILQRKLAPEHWKIHYASSLVGASLMAQGHYEEAEAMLMKSYQQLTARLQTTAWPIRQIHDWLIELYELMGRPDQIKKFVG